MPHIQDLRLERDLLPLLDFTKNHFSQKILSDLLLQPLYSLGQIRHRQHILQGFMANREVLHPFSYHRSDLLEVIDFLKPAHFSPKYTFFQKMNMRLFEQKKHQKASKFIQTILLLHKFQTFYFAKINLAVFPPDYQEVLKNMYAFLSYFDLARYEHLIRTEKFKIKHLVEVQKLFSEKIKNGETEKFWQNYFLFEAYLSLSIAIIKYDWQFPTFSENRFQLIDFYHPFLTNPVKNSLETDKRVILLTGANMSGKSTFLKAISLCVYLAHIGLGVPASEACLPFVENIHVSINLQDDLQNGFSHFMTEIQNLKNVVLEAASQKKCFAVFDELFRGTNHEDALETSTATLQGLTKFKNSFFFVSTHLQELKEIEKVRNQEIATYYIDCQLNAGNPRFTYELKTGWSDLKIGRILFEKAGLDKLLA